MPNFFSGLLKGLFGQQDQPDIESISPERILGSLKNNMGDLTNLNVDFAKGTAVPLANISKEIEGIYDPFQSSLRSNTSKAIQDDLALGSALPDDVADLVKRQALERGASSGIGGSQAGRNLVARDLGLTSLDLLNNRLDRAKGYVRSAPLFNLQPSISPGLVAGIGVESVGANNQNAILKSNINNQNNTNMINSLIKIAMAAATSGASLGVTGLGNQPASVPAIGYPAGSDQYASIFSGR